MTNYVLGFAFDTTKNYVVLIKKQKPSWQKGYFNGVGGKVEEDDATMYDAMSREFKEETGVLIHATSWHYFGIMGGEDWQVDMFRCFDNSMLDCVTKESEEVHIKVVADLNYEKCIENLTWIIPLALSKENIFTITNYEQ